jgi:peptide deformylase
MAVRRIRIWPDPALKETAAPVTDVDGSVKLLVEDMFETMYKANGVGLAATQVAEAKRILVIDLDPRAQGKTDAEVRAELDSWGFKGPTAFINPQIVSSEGSIVWQEGCLSVPGVVDDVKRKEHVIVRALNTDGEYFDTEATGLFAVALQHEMDHLDGRVFVEYLSKLKRDVIRRKMDRVREEAQDDGVRAAATL